MTRSSARRPKLRVALIVVIGALLAAAVAFRASYDDSGGRGKGKGAKPSGPALSGNQALLSGTVIDAESKTPLPGARLVIDQEGGRITVVADAKGHYRTVVNVSRPIGFTADAPAHQGTAGFGKLCPGERRELTLSLPPAGTRSAPPAPLVLRGDCG